MEVVDIWCELRLPRAQDSTEPQLLQASLANFGGFFDWLDANFEVLGGGAHRDSNEDSDL